MAKSKYRVYAPNGTLIVEGISHECAEALGIGVKSFRNALSRKAYAKYRIEDVSERVEKQVSSVNADLVKAWDDFCDPIRKKYGVKVKRFIYDETGKAHEI